MYPASQTDMCVSIDFGTTLTGVGWTFPTVPNGKTRVLQGEDTVYGKFPTALSKYPPGKWGLRCQEIPEQDKWRAFKIFVEQAQLDKAHENGLIWTPATANEVLEIDKDYLHHLYVYISQKLPMLTKNKRTHPPGNAWSDWNIEFIFSVPATWSWAQRKSFKDIVKKAASVTL